jgi:hypothetical protein
LREFPGLYWLQSSSTLKKHVEGQNEVSNAQRQTSATFTPDTDPGRMFRNLKDDAVVQLRVGFSNNLYSSTL